MNVGVVWGVGTVARRQRDGAWEGARGKAAGVGGRGFAGVPGGDPL